MGRHRKPRRAGLPPLVSGAGIVAALATTLALVQPADLPPAHFTLPAPTPAVRATTPPPTPTPTPAPTTSLTPTITAPVVTVKVEPTTTRPKPTTTTPAPKPKPTAKVEPKPATKPSAKCTGLGVLPQVERACEQITAAVPGITVIGGRAARPGNPTSCHPAGLALDLMTYDDTALGDRIVAYVRAHRDELGVTTILWRVPDHYSHPHLSFAPCTH